MKIEQTPASDEENVVSLIVELARVHERCTGDKKYWTNRRELKILLKHGGRICRHFRELGGKYYVEVSLGNLAYINVDPAPFEA